MFHAYLQLVARHFNWLGRTFPRYMYAHPRDLKFMVKALLATPGLVLLVFLPLILIMVAELSLPVGDGLRLLLIATTILLLFFLIAREAIRELKKK